jgi:hypothetical protein
VLDANPLLLNALNNATIVRRSYEQGLRYIIEEKQKIGMYFVDDLEFEQAVLDKKEHVNNG